MTTPETVLRDNDTTTGGALYLSFELGDKRGHLLRHGTEVDYDHIGRSVHGPCRGEYPCNPNQR
jgi:hypothetical protein